MPAAVKFNEKYLIDRSIPEPNTGCWLWLGSVSQDGYSQVGKPPWSGHRIAFEVKHGPVPEGMEVDHICRVRCCVNPDHMQPLTHYDNLIKSYRKVSPNSLKTHCPKGHPLDGENLRLKKTSTRLGVSRQCKACERDRYQAKRKPK